MTPLSFGDNAAPLIIISLPETLSVYGSRSCAPEPYANQTFRLSIASPTPGADHSPLRADHYDFAVALAATFVCIAAATVRRRR